MRNFLLMAVAVCFGFAAQASAAEFSADMNISTMGMKMTSKIYYKDFKTSRTEVMGTVVITSDPVSYQLFENTKRYVVMDPAELAQQSPMAEADDFAEFVEKNDIRKVDTETIGEYKCDVYEGAIKYDEAQPAVAMKLWYSPKLDYPVKTETQLPAPMTGTSVSTLENVKIGNQPDSLFEIPAGYTQAQSVQEAMGMGSFPMSSDDDEDQMPTQEEMNKMMQMMQEMMGGQGE